MPALFIQNEDDAPAGLLGEWAAARGLPVDTVRPDRGESLPEPNPGDWQFAAVLGSAASVLQADTVPWIASELRWLERADAHGLPILAICFGAQALAAALGGSVRRAARPEVGWISVEWLAPEPGPPGAHAAGPWFTWHEDALEPPSRARTLARTATGVQAFAVGRHLAVQFHPEVTPAIVAGWAATAGEEFAFVDAAAVRAESERLAPTAAQNAFALFDAFFTSCAASPA